MKLPQKPKPDFPRPVIGGQLPTAAQVAADAEHQGAIDAWIDEVAQPYFRHFGIAER